MLNTDINLKVSGDALISLLEENHSMTRILFGRRDEHVLPEAAKQLLERNTALAGAQN